MTHGESRLKMIARVSLRTFHLIKMDDADRAVFGFNEYRGEQVRLN